MIRSTMRTTPSQLQNILSKIRKFERLFKKNLHKPKISSTFAPDLKTTNLLTIKFLKL